MHANIQHTCTHISLAGMFAYVNTHKSQTTSPFLVWCRLDHLHMNSAHKPLESVCRPCLSIATVHWVSKISNYLPEVREQVPSTNPRIGLSPINLHSADDRYEKGKESLMPAPDLQRSINLVIRSANNNCQRRGGERRGFSLTTVYVNSSVMLPFLISSWWNCWGHIAFPTIHLRAGWQK